MSKAAPTSAAWPAIRRPATGPCAVADATTPGRAPRQARRVGRRMVTHALAGPGSARRAAQAVSAPTPRAASGRALPGSAPEHLCGQVIGCRTHPGPGRYGRMGYGAVRTDRYAPGLATLSRRTAPVSRHQSQKSPRRGSAQVATSPCGRGHPVGQEPPPRYGRLRLGLGPGWRRRGPLGRPRRGGGPRRWAGACRWRGR